jgi:SMI1-KNR4 cell-wall
MVKLVGSYKQLTIAEIESFEALNKIRFPESYKEFLLANNGGRPTPNNILDVPGWRYKSTVISYFFGIDTGDTYDLLKNINSYRDRIPQDFTPIADDVAGNILCLGVEGAQEGKIFFWDHENEMDENDNYTNMYYVANDIFELLNKLRSDEGQDR